MSSQINQISQSKQTEHNFNGLKYTYQEDFIHSEYRFDSGNDGIMWFDLIEASKFDEIYPFMNGENNNAADV